MANTGAVGLVANAFATGESNWLVTTSWSNDVKMIYVLPGQRIGRSREVSEEFGACLCKCCLPWWGTWGQNDIVGDWLWLRDLESAEPGVEHLFFPWRLSLVKEAAAVGRVHLDQAVLNCQTLTFSLSIQQTNYTLPTHHPAWGLRHRSIPRSCGTAPSLGVGT
jgi:hypothetical protein